MPTFILVRETSERNQRGPDGEFEFKVLRPRIVNFDFVRQISPPLRPSDRPQYGYVELSLVGGNDSYPIRIRETFEEIQDKLKSSKTLIE